MSKRDHSAFVGDEIFNRDLAFIRDDLGKTFVGVLGLNITQLFFDDRKDAELAPENIDKIPDGVQKRLIFLLNTFPLQCR